MRATPGVRSGRKGFTLMELMVVVMIMAILGTIVLGITGYAGRKAAASRAMAQIQEIKNALEEYRLKNATYPPTSGPASNVLAVLTNTFPSLSLRDPWERSYQYQSLGRYQFRLWSYGADGLSGTPAEKADDIENL